MIWQFPKNETGHRKIMKQFILSLFILLGYYGCNGSDRYRPQNGDIIFQVSRSSQSHAVQLATKSKYSHMGIVYLQDDKPYVFEAVEPVRTTPLSDWIDRGEEGHYIVKRLANAEDILIPDALERMLSEGQKFKGKHYDLYFEWSDESIYCSELVWKIYKRALDIELGELQTIADFDLSHPIVKTKIQERFGGPPPINETVIAPQNIFDCDQLVTAYRR